MNVHHTAVGIDRVAGEAALLLEIAQELEHELLEGLGRRPQSLNRQEIQQLLGQPRGTTPAALRDRALLELLYGCGRIAAIDPGRLSEILSEPRIAQLARGVALDHAAALQVAVALLAR